MANHIGQEMGGVGGGQGAWLLVNYDWKGHLWLCRRGRLKGQWWFGSGQWEGLKSGVGWPASPKYAVREAIAVPELVPSPGRRWKGGARKGSWPYLGDTGNTKVRRGSPIVRTKRRGDVS